MGHGPAGNDKWQYEIPMLVWTSELCKKNHPELLQKISAAKDKPFMTDNMIHAILDLMKSLFSEDVDATRKRIYKNNEYVNGKIIPTGS